MAHKSKVKAQAAAAVGPNPLISLVTSRQWTVGAIPPAACRTCPDSRPKISPAVHSASPASTLSPNGMLISAGAAGSVLISVRSGGDRPEMRDACTSRAEWCGALLARWHVCWLLEGSLPCGSRAAGPAKVPVYGSLKVRSSDGSVSQSVMRLDRISATMCDSKVVEQQSQDKSRSVSRDEPIAHFTKTPTTTRRIHARASMHGMQSILTQDDAATLRNSPIDHDWTTSLASSAGLVAIVSDTKVRLRRTLRCALCVLGVPPGATTTQCLSWSKASMCSYALFLCKGVYPAVRPKHARKLADPRTGGKK